MIWKRLVQNKILRFVFFNIIGAILFASFVFVLSFGIDRFIKKTDTINLKIIEEFFLIFITPSLLIIPTIIHAILHIIATRSLNSSEYEYDKVYFTLIINIIIIIIVLMCLISLFTSNGYNYDNYYDYMIDRIP